MKNLNILAVDQIFKINQSPINDRLVGSPLAPFAKEVYFHYEPIVIESLVRDNTNKKFVINGKFDLPYESGKSDAADSYYADEAEVIAVTVALNETVWEQLEQRRDTLKKMADFLAEAVKFDQEAAKRLKK